MRKRNAVNAESLNFWTCCGRNYASGIKRCSTCGRMRSDDRPAADSNAERKCDESPALELPASAAPVLAWFTGPVVVWIERYAASELDDDNFVAGCKELRDSIAEMLGRKGDSEDDGISFKYRQIKSREKKTAIIIQKLNILS